MKRKKNKSHKIHQVNFMFDTWHLQLVNNIHRKFTIGKYHIQISFTSVKHHTKTVTSTISVSSVYQIAVRQIYLNIIYQW